MPRIKLSIPLGFYQSESRPLSVQRCINWIPTVSENEALNAKSLMQVSGLSQFSDALKSGCRGGRTVSGVPFFVNADSLVSVSSAGVTTNHGQISGTKRVVMADNGTLLVIVVPGGESFVWDGSTLQNISDPDFQISDTVSFYRGFFVFTTTDGKQLFVSNLNTPLVFDALDFGSAEGDPDRIITQILDHDELSIIGERTTEVFKLVGGAGFPLQIIPGAYTEKGAHSKYGVIKFDNTYIFLGGGINERSAVWRQTSSASAVKISTNAIDNAIQEFNSDEIAEAFFMNYSQKGQVLAALTINSTRIPSRTFVYNATASALSGLQVWFEMQSGVKDNSWRVNTILNAYGKFLTGDDSGSLIGELDEDNFTEFGNPMFRHLATSPFNQDGTVLFAGEFEATFESGTGLTLGQGSDPQVRMDYSDNGGRSFSSETSRSIGKIGEYIRRSIWRRQGRIPVSRTIRLTITDPVVANVLKLSATVEVGTK